MFGVLGGSEEGTRSCGTGVMNSCEPPCGRWTIHYSTSYFPSKEMASAFCSAEGIFPSVQMTFSMLTVKGQACQSWKYMYDKAPGNFVSIRDSIPWGQSSVMQMFGPP